ncbi:hypothetical protein HanPI659440_Chr10g0378631 [Helianthus annuus]|nr:hypothetical protein HanPI659440_Chr10g0378631 [Helianthus annuus]
MRWRQQLPILSRFVACSRSEQIVLQRLGAPMSLVLCKPTPLKV